jgi:hypothetical protein
MDLRDRFAVHFAAALVDAFPANAELARRAYDLADALMAERARRIDAEEAQAVEGAVETERLASSHALLDEPAPLLEPDAGWDEDADPRLLEAPYDPSWDLDDRRELRPGPGLARTQPGEAEGKERTG